MRLNHNMSSLRIYSSYNDNLSCNSTALSRISSGLKIQSAKDNPKKIAQSGNMKMQIKGLSMASRNAQDSISMMQTFDGAMQEMNNSLNRMKELAVSAADGTKSEADRAAIQDEIEILKGNMRDLANNTEFNGIKIIGDKAVTNNDIPGERKSLIGAFAGEQVSVPTFNLNLDMLGIKQGDTIVDSLADINLTTVDGANAAMEVIKQSTKIVADIRSKYGAISGRFETAQDNIGVISGKIENAQSDICDADIATEALEISRTDIILQSQIALLAQTNRMPQDALNILANSKR